MKLWVIDTSASPDVIVDNAYLTVSPLRGTGRSWACGTTGSVGYLSGGLNYGDTIIERFFLPGYTAPDSPDTVVVADSTFEDTIFVYHDTATYTCTVWGQAKDLNGGILRNRPVTFSLAGSVHNTCDSTYYVATSKTVITDASGLFTCPLIWSACLNDVKYFIQVDNQSKKSFTVPSLSSYRITL